MTNSDLVSNLDALPSGAPSAARVRGQTIARVARHPAAWLALVVGLSTLVRGAIALGVPSPWILPDEIVYSELAKSIAGGHRPEVRGIPVFGWGEVYPTLVAPAWALVDSTVDAYRTTLFVNGLLMSLAAVPAYLLARMFVSRRGAVLVAVMTVLVPSMAYTGVVMTENAFYPVFVLTVLLVARAVERPTAGRQALVLGALVLVAFTRIQGLALAGAYVAAAVLYGVAGPRTERTSYLRRFAPTAALLLVAGLAPAAASLARGDGPFGWLGARSSTFAGFHASEVPEWFLYLASDLILYVAVIPVAAAAVVTVRGLRRGASERSRLYAAVALSTVVAMLGSVALVSAALDVDGTENLNERYVFYVVPLLFLGLALWLEQRSALRRRWAWAVVAACCVAVVALPIDRLHYNSGFQSLALIPWIVVPISGLALAAATGVFVLACGALWVTCSWERSGRLWLVVGAWMSVVALLTVGSNTVSAGDAASHAFGGQSPEWVDAAVPRGASVAIVWDERSAPVDRPGPVSFRLMVLEEFNRSLGTVYRIGRPTYYETFLPTVPVRVAADGTLLRNGRPLRAAFVLVPCRTPIEGRVLGAGAHGSVRLVAVPGTIRLAASGRRCG